MKQNNIYKGKLGDQYANERWFYKYNRKTGRYDEIDEPHILKDHGPIGGIG